MIKISELFIEEGVMIPLPASCLVFELCLFCTCVMGDYLLKQKLIYKENWSRSLIDNLTHGLIGGFSWAVVVSGVNMGSVMECALCMALAMSVDLDHFLAAKSLSLQDALSLPDRPPFHATTIIPVIATALCIISLVSKWRYVWTICVIFITAWLSHHIRDASRRGMWFWPFCTTPAIPYWLYVAFTLLLPVIVKGIMAVISNNSQNAHTISVPVDERV